MPDLRYVSLVNNGQDQLLTIPSEFALPGTQVVLRKEGNCLIIEPIQPNSLLALLTTLEDIPDPFPELDAGLLPLDDIAL